MLPDLINVHGVQDRFVIEARTAAHLDHPGIVTVYAVKQRAGLLYIDMKYIEGHTLEAALRAQGQIDPTAAALHRKPGGGGAALRPRRGRGSPRAETVKRLMVGEVAAVGTQLQVRGVGYRQNIVGTGADDASDAVDRRVEFKVVECKR